MSKIESIQTELRELRMKKPFRPFRIVTSDGKKYTVGRPLWFAFNDKLIVVLLRGGASRRVKFDDVDRVELVSRKR